MLPQGWGRGKRAGQRGQLEREEKAFAASGCGNGSARPCRQDPAQAGRIAPGAEAGMRSKVSWLVPKRRRLGNGCLCVSRRIFSEKA